MRENPRSCFAFHCFRILAKVDFRNLCLFLLFLNDSLPLLTMQSLPIFLVFIFVVLPSFLKLCFSLLTLLFSLKNFLRHFFKEVLHTVDYLIFPSSENDFYFPLIPQGYFHQLQSSGLTVLLPYTTTVPSTLRMLYNFLLLWFLMRNQQSFKLLFTYMQCFSLAAFKIFLCL